MKNERRERRLRDSRRWGQVRAAPPHFLPPQIASRNTAGEPRPLGPIPSLTSQAKADLGEPLPVPQFPHGRGQLGEVRPDDTSCHHVPWVRHHEEPFASGLCHRLAGSRAGRDPSSRLPDKSATFQIIPDSKFFESL